MLHAEVYFYPGDEVQDCCPAVVYRVLPCLAGDESSPFWESWNRHRLIGSRYGKVMDTGLYS